MKRKNSLPKNSHGPGEIPAPEVAAPELNLAEHALGLWSEALQRGVLHIEDRPEAETRVLRFVAQALDPTAEGVARQTGLSADETCAALVALEGAGLVWGQMVAAAEPGWRLSDEGHRYLAARELLPPPLPQP